MPVKIRLMRIGATKRPFYRVVAVDERKKRTGAYLELLGTYNPLTEPKEIILKQDSIDNWLKKGAQPSDGFLRITGKAPQRPPRKPKKEQKAAPAEGSTTTTPPPAAATTTEPLVEDQKTPEPAENPAEARSEEQSTTEATAEETTDTTQADEVTSEPSEKSDKSENSHNPDTLKEETQP